MKLSFFILVLFLTMSCEVEDTAPATPPAPGDAPDLDGAVITRQGVIMGVNHTATGTASVYEKDGKSYVVLDPFMSENGPDLKVYLSKDVAASEYVGLGNLQSTAGRRNYTVPAGDSPVK